MMGLLLSLLLLGANSTPIDANESNLVLHVPLTSEHTGSATIARDLSSTQATCTAAGTPPTFASDGTDFNGTLDYIDCGDNGSTLDFGDASTDRPFSVCVWAEPDVVVGTIVSKGASPLFAWVLQFSGGPAVQFLSYDNNSSIYRGTRTTDAPSINEWIHICGTYDGSAIPAGYSLYFDGALQPVGVALSSGSYTAMHDSTDPVEIGRRNTSLTNGKLRDVRVYAAELSATEVKSLYDATKDSVPNTEASLESGVVLRMPLTSGYEARDLGAAQLTFVEGGTPTYGAEGATFAAASNEYLESSTADYRIGDSAGTLHVWFKDSEPTVAIFASASEVDNSYYFSLYVNVDGRLWLTASDGSANFIIGQTIDLDDNTWHHAAVTSNGSRYLMYVDGAPEAFDVIAGTDNGDWLGDIPNRDNVTVGVRHRTAYSAYFNGTIGGLEVLSVELSAAEIKRIYDKGNPVAKTAAPSTESGVVLRMPLTSGYEARDLGAAQLTFVEGGTPTYGAEGVTLNGASDYLETTIADFRGSDSSGTIHVWFKTDFTSRVVFSTSDESVLNFYMALYVNSAGRAWFIASTSFNANYVLGLTENIDDNAWHHVAITSNGSRYLMYLDGEPEAFDILSGTDDGDWFSVVTGRDNFVVGARHRTSYDGYFKGAIGGLEVLSVELSAAEVKDIYDRGNP